MKTAPSTSGTGLLAAAFAAVLCLLCAAAPARAEYPERAVRLIVPYPAGGSSDIVGRVFAERLERELGRPVVVENMGGGGGALGAQKVATAPADGYALLVGSGSELLIRGLLQPTPYDVTRDFTPITLIGTGPMVIIGKPGLPAPRLEDLLALARAQPGALSYGSAGQGTFMHVLGEAFKAKAGLQITHVPYRGAAPMMADVMGGHVELGVASLASALSAIERGQVRGYAVTSRERVGFAPAIPALSELPELSGLELELWIGLFAPRGLPAPVAARLEAAAGKVIGADGFKAKLAEQALVARPMTGEAFRDYLVRERDKYRAIIEGSGITLQ